MIDLPLMTKLFEALPEQARVILLGDREQLASVEAGSVLSDICSAAQFDGATPCFSEQSADTIKSLTGFDLVGTSETNNVINDHLVVLQKSHRFAESSGISELARYIQSGNAEGMHNLLQQNRYQDVRWQDNLNTNSLLQALLPLYSEYFDAVNSADVVAVFRRFNEQQILCSQKRGQWGTEGLNNLIESNMQKQGLIRQRDEFYPGRPVMVTQNDHVIKLYNGDIGIALPDTQQGGLMKVWFQDVDGTYRGVTPARLPAHETVYAMTIHKSQGSEFKRVFLCLPDTHKEQTFGLNRELIYTGLTRAREAFYLYASRQTLAVSINSVCKRSSGLADRLMHKAVSE